VKSFQGFSEQVKSGCSAANALEMAPVFIAIVLLALFGIALVSLVTYIENRFCNW